MNKRQFKGIIRRFYSIYGELDKIEDLTKKCRLKLGKEAEKIRQLAGEDLT